jgi:hypothetical protein
MLKRPVVSSIAMEVSQLRASFNKPSGYEPSFLHIDLMMIIAKDPRNLLYVGDLVIGAYNYLDPEQKNRLCRTIISCCEHNDFKLRQQAFTLLIPLLQKNYLMPEEQGIVIDKIIEHCDDQVLKIRECALDFMYDFFPNLDLKDKQRFVDKLKCEGSFYLDMQAFSDKFFKKYPRFLANFKDESYPEFSSEERPLVNEQAYEGESKRRKYR